MLDLLYSFLLQIFANESDKERVDDLLISNRCKTNLQILKL